eukprot:70080_1
MDSNITKTYDPFPKLTEYNEAKIPSPKVSPKSSPSKNDNKSDDIMSSPVIKLYNKDNKPMPKPMNLTDKIDEMINIINGPIYKEPVNDKPVLVEWQPPTEKSVHKHAKDKDDKVFVKWTKDQKNESNEDLQNLEKDYLNLNKLQQQNNKQTKDENRQ